MRLEQPEKNIFLGSVDRALASTLILTDIIYIGKRSPELPCGVEDTGLKGHWYLSSGQVSSDTEFRVSFHTRRETRQEGWEL